MARHEGEPHRGSPDIEPAKDLSSRLPLPSQNGCGIPETRGSPGPCLTQVGARHRGIDAEASTPSRNTSDKSPAPGESNDPHPTAKSGRTIHTGTYASRPYLR